MQAAQDEYAWAAVFDPDSLEYAEVVANAQAIEAQAQALFGSAERWGA